LIEHISGLVIERQELNMTSLGAAPLCSQDGHTAEPPQIG